MNRSYPRSLLAGRLLVLGLTLAAIVMAAGALSASAAKPPDAGPPDPCEQADVPGNANGTHRRCEGQGGGSGVARGDFNGDGTGDLAVGVPYEDVGSAVDAGAVNIVYGSATGLTASGNQFFHQDSPGVSGAAQASDHFGWALAAGDFDGDGFSDLAVGIPDEDTSGVVDEGGVQVFRGSATGLTPWQFWNATNATLYGL